MGFEKKEEFEETSFLARNVTPITTWCICFIFWIAVGMDPEDKMTQPPVGESKMEYGGGVFLILTVRFVCTHICILSARARSVGSLPYDADCARWCTREKNDRQTDGSCRARACISCILSLALSRAQIVITLWATMTVTTTEKVYAEQLEAYRVRLEQQQ